MRRKYQICSFIIIIAAAFSGCSSVNQTNAISAIHQTSSYEKISPEEAKQAMDSGDSYILLDVRYQNEYDDEHILTATLIPVDEIEDRAETELPDKDTLILVYCASGTRSKTASEKLIEMGYTYVKDIGGIDTWPYNDKE